MISFFSKKAVKGWTVLKNNNIKTYFREGLSTRLLFGVWYKMEYNCCICLQENIEKENILQLYCNHIFCKECITYWCQLNESCPMCKMTIIPELDFLDKEKKLEETSLIICPATGCKKPMLYKDVRIHYKEKHKKCPCRFCGETVMSHILGKHEGAYCQYRPRPCPTENCHDIIPYYVFKAIVNEKPSSRQCTFEEKTYSSAAGFLKEHHDCQSLLECDLCHRYYKDHYTLVEHCSIQHPSTIKHLVGSRKRKASKQAEKNIQLCMDITNMIN